MPIAPLRVQMLGGFTIRREDAEVSVNQRSRKLCLLLAYLIQARSRPVPYSELTGLLWKEPNAGSLNMLKAVLHRARACLDQLEEGAGRELLLSREGCCQWNPEAPLTLDAEEFVRLCREGGQAGGEEQRLTLWRSALELYRGDFLPGLSAHPWAAGQAGPLRQTFLQTFQRLLPLLSAREEWPEVERLAGMPFFWSPAGRTCAAGGWRLCSSWSGRRRPGGSMRTFTRGCCPGRGCCPPNRCGSCINRPVGSWTPAPSPPSSSRSSCVKRTSSDPFFANTTSSGPSAAPFPGWRSGPERPSTPPFCPWPPEETPPWPATAWTGL